MRSWYSLLCKAYVLGRQWQCIRTQMHTFWYGRRYCTFVWRPAMHLTNVTWIVRLFGSYDRKLCPISLPRTTLCDFIAVNNQLYVCGSDKHVTARELSWPRQKLRSWQVSELQKQLSWWKQKNRVKWGPNNKTLFNTLKTNVNLN